LLLARVAQKQALAAPQQAPAGSLPARVALQKALAESQQVRVALYRAVAVALLAWAGPSMQDRQRQLAAWPVPAV
jgi:hypothetical protein